MNRRKSLLWISVMAASYFCAAVEVQVEPQSTTGNVSYDEDTWHVNISPYLWMAGMNGTLSLGGHQAQVNQSFGDIFSNLKFGLMGLTEVRRGRIGILTDLMWIRLGDETSIPLQSLPTGVSLKTSINTFTFTPWLAYRLFGNNRASIDMLTGGRYYHLYGKITADAGSAGQLSYSRANNWADFVEGGRIMFNLTPRVGAFVIGDAGGGGSDLTWQVAGGVGYRWTKRWSTQLGYRRLYFDRTDNKLGASSKPSRAFC